MSERKETATFAGGCFWCFEAIFRRLKGVVSVTSGYAGGEMGETSYEEVSTGVTGHAEAIQILFDPKIISFRRLLDVFWMMHDPTTLNRQGGDIGTQYRSVIFYHSEEQKREAILSREKLEKKKKYKGKIVTEIIPYTAFYPAEEYHQNFYEKNKMYPYCAIVISPKIKKLLDKFGTIVK